MNNRLGFRFLDRSAFLDVAENDPVISPAAPSVAALVNSRRLSLGFRGMGILPVTTGRKAVLQAVPHLSAPPLPA
jgi:hypothetical protein